MSHSRRRLPFFQPVSAERRHPFRRGVSLLPSLFTMGNLFCGYACIVYAMRGEFETAAPLIGIAIVLDMLDGRIARLTGTSSEFGLQLDSLADVVSFGIAPAILTFAWGSTPLERLGWEAGFLWAAGFLFVTAAAMRLARFNLQSPAGGDKRYFVGLPSPAAAAVPAATVFAASAGLSDYSHALLALSIVLVPAVLMVSTMRFRSFKTIDLQVRRPYSVLFLIAAGLTLIAIHPKYVLVVMAYAYLLSAFVGVAAARIRQRKGRAPASPSVTQMPLPSDRRHVR